MSHLDVELWVAASLDAHTWAARLLAQGASPDVAMGRDGVTAVHVACRRGGVRTLRQLARAGADLEKATAHRAAWTPLIMAIQHHQRAVLEVLLACGVDVHHRVSRLPPVFWAANGGHDVFVHRLLEAGAGSSLTEGDVGYLAHSRRCKPEIRRMLERIARPST